MLQVLGHFQEDELSLYINGNLEPNRVSEVEGHLAECSECKQKLDRTLHFITRFAGLGGRERSFHPLEKRGEPRFVSESATSVQALRPLSFERLTGRIVNVARSGVALILKQTLEPGTLVQVRVGTLLLLGEVRHSTKTGDEFTIGVQLEDVVSP